MRRYIGRFRAPGDGYPPFVEIWAFNASDASRMLDAYCQDNSFTLRGLYKVPEIDGLEQPATPFCRDFGKGEHPGLHEKKNIYVAPDAAVQGELLACPRCGGYVRDDPKNPGKVLCDACRRRMPRSAAVPVRPEAPSKGTSRQAASGGWLLLVAAIFAVIVLLAVLSLVTGSPILRFIGTLAGVAGLPVMAFSSAMLLMGRKARGDGS